MQDDVGILERVPELIIEREVRVRKTEGKEDKEIRENYLGTTE